MNEAQEICKSCGLCCDGTLFGHVKLRSEDNTSTYSKFGRTGIAGNMQLNQPCKALKINGECGVYSDRPCSCREFSCKLLKRFQKGELSHKDAIDRVNLAKKNKAELVDKAQEAGIFSDSQLKVFRFVINHIESDLSSKECKKMYPELHLKHTALGYFLGKNFYSRKNKSGE